jgi:hypothetical protein
MFNKDTITAIIFISQVDEEYGVGLCIADLLYIDPKEEDTEGF